MTPPGDLAARVGALDTGSLLPPRRSGAITQGDVVLRDSVSLGDGLALAVVTDGDGLLVTPIVARDAEPVRRAEPGDGAFERLLRRLASGAPGGRFSFEPFGSVPAAAGERAIDVDQSNESVVVGDRAVVKLYPRTGGSPDAGSDLPAHLISVGFTSIPTPYGIVGWRDDDGHHKVVASAASYLPGARDGWEWYLAGLLAWLDGEVDDEAAFETASVLGRLAAHMHIALATGSEIVPTPRGTANEATAQAWRRGARTVADEALAVTDGEQGKRLTLRRNAILAELDRLGEAAEAVLTRVHGDFHAGQVLEWQGGYAVTDFDGDPMASPTTHDSLDTPVRDVAAFVRSIDHLGRIASSRRAGSEAAVSEWIGSSRAGFLGAYRSELAVRGEERLYDERLLRPLEVAQECHEYIYAARFLPGWLRVADLAMCSLISLED